MTAPLLETRRPELCREIDRRDVEPAPGRTAALEKIVGEETNRRLHPRPPRFRTVPRLDLGRGNSRHEGRDQYRRCRRVYDSPPPGSLDDHPVESLAVPGRRRVHHGQRRVSRHHW